MTEIKRGVNQIWQLLLSIQSRQQSERRSATSQTEIRPSTVYISSLMLAGQTAEEQQRTSESSEPQEQADKYIKEHIKAYKVDSKTPTAADLKKRSHYMKDEYNSNLRELQTLEKKHSVTSRYSRTIRNYINQQTNKRVAEQSHQRRLTQQKKKDTLE